MTPVTIGGRALGPDQPPFVVAEMSGNHNGDIGRAMALIDAAKAAGADAVKLQTYTADTITIDHDGPEFVVHGGLWDGRRLYDLYQEAHTPWDWHGRLFDHARQVGIEIFSSPFDPTAVALLQTLGAPAYKIASFELIDSPLIELCAATGKPLIMSTGLASPQEIAEAVAAAKGAGDGGIVLLHCTSAYPAPMCDMNLKTLQHLADAHRVLVGLSDHTLGVAASVAAVALGACFIEKHFTLSRAEGGVDSDFSLEPHELARLVAECRDAWAALGEVRYDEAPSEAASRDHRRSLYVVADIAAGEPLTPANVRSIRPGHGLPPKHLPEVVGRRAARDLKRGSPLDWSMLA
ncbi:pseudaminic acid synthase [Phenylobacterium sp.]|jgi:N-acetylneuraminate synthase|uniref:pseudaminic acid synthase n=1 Tax=Phenylobacterium sp. TaxID=1871053 RepID=UPI002F952B25